MKIRLMGDGDKVTAMIAALQAAPGLRITDVSRPYPNRGNPAQVRVYLDAEVTEGTRPGRAGGARC